MFSRINAVHLFSVEFKFVYAYFAYTHAPVNILQFKCLYVGEEIASLQ